MLGVVLFEMCTAESLFLNSYDNLDEEGLKLLYAWSDNLKREKLTKIKDDKARNLVGRLLTKDARLRPSLQAVLAHPFLSGKVSKRMIGEQAKFNVFISYRVASDADHAEIMYNKLTAAGLTVWWEKVIIAQRFYYFILCNHQLL